MLDLKEFQNVVGDIIERYPQVDIYLKKNQMKDMATLLSKSQESPTTEVDIEYFKQALSKVDSQMKNLPATAQVNLTFISVFPAKFFYLYMFWLFQVAAQQGAYLADCFNRMELCEKYPEGPLRFRGTGRHQFHAFRYVECTI